MGTTTPITPTSEPEAPTLRRMTRRRLLKWGLSAGAAWLATTPYTYRAVESRHTLWFRNLPAEWDGATILHLSDFHHGPFTPAQYLQPAIERARALPHDIAFFTGDFVSVSASYFDNIAGWLRDWPAPLGAFACLGNHDHWTGAAQIRRALEGIGLPVLVNRSVTADRNGSRIRIVGVDDPSTSQSDLKLAMEGVPDGEYRILLAHSPDIVWGIAESQFDLVLSGHTHGGQVCLPGGQALVCPTNLGCDYASGLFRWRKATLFVNRGLGITGFPLRAFCPPEIALLTLRRGKGSGFGIQDSASDGINQR